MTDIQIVEATVEGIFKRSPDKTRRDIAENMLMEAMDDKKDAKKQQVYQLQHGKSNDRYKCACIYVRDTTRRVKSINQYIKSRKMKSIGGIVQTKPQVIV